MRWWVGLGLLGIAGCLVSPGDPSPVLSLAGTTYEAREVGRVWIWHVIVFREDATYHWEWGGVDSVSGANGSRRGWEEGTWALDPAGIFLTASGTTTGLKLSMRITGLSGDRRAIGFSYEYWVFWDGNWIRFGGIKWHRRGAMPKVTTVSASRSVFY